MKKLLLLLLLICSVGFISACGGDKNSTPSNSAATSSNFPQWNIVD